MRTARIVAAVVALSALAPAVTRAQTPAPAPRSLTMDEALAMAKHANKNLVVERARLAQAHTNIEQAWSALFPVVTAQGKYTRNYKNATLDFGALLMGLGFTADRDGDAVVTTSPSSSRTSSTPTSAPSCRSSRRPPTRPSTR